MVHLRTLIIVVVLSFPMQSSAEARAQADAVVECLNEKSARNTELRLFKGDGPIAQILEPGDYNNVCTAHNYFCVVSPEVSWMFSWNIVLKVEERSLLGFDIRPENGQAQYLLVPNEIGTAISECGVDWQGHWVGEALFYAPEPKPSTEVPDVAFTSRPWDGTIKDLLPPVENWK